MKSYQSPDSLHGHGKATPKAKSMPQTRAQKQAQRKLWKKQQRVLENAVILR